MKKVNPLQKFAAICVASVLTLSSLGFVNVSSASDTVDVALEQITHTAFMKGYPDNTFRPDGNITRAELAQIILNLSENHSAYAPTFTDVSDNSVWYYIAIGHLESLNIVDGYPDGTFNPEKPCTRSELVAVLSRFQGGTSDWSAEFTDVPGTHWAASYINYAFTKGWISGYSDGSFEPDRNCTRAEAATLINRVLSRTDETLSASANPFTDISEIHWAFGNVMEACVAHDFVGSIYHSVLAAYKQAVINGYENIDLELISIELRANNFDDNHAVYYAYKDIDGNGVPELFIGAGEDAAKAIYDIYTYHDGKPVRLFDYDFGRRTNCVVFPNGVLAVSRSSNAFYWGIDFYNIATDGFSPEHIERISVISSREDDSITFHRSSPEAALEIAEAEYDESTEAEYGQITESEYNQILRKYFGADPVYRGAVDLKWVSILER